MVNRSILKEDFNLVKGTFTAKDNKKYKVIMIDPSTS